jgi:hypothetical protein
MHPVSRTHILSPRAQPSPVYRGTGDCFLAERGISVLGITGDRDAPEQYIHLMKMSTMRTVWSSRSNSISSNHFQTLFHEQPERMSRVRAISNHFFILCLTRIERDPYGRRSETDDTSPKQRRQVWPISKPISRYFWHRMVIISNFIDFFNLL